MRHYLICVIALVLLSASQKAIGQSFSYSKIPALNIDDFKASTPEQSGKSVAHTTCSVLYDVESIRKVSGGGVMVTYKLQAIMRKERSWINKNLLSDKKRLSEVLQHERGHVVIANILASKLKSKMSKIYYGDYVVQAREIFQTIFNEFRSFELKYDEETNHSINQIKQTEWNNKLKNILPN